MLSPSLFPGKISALSMLRALAVHFLEQVGRDDTIRLLWTGRACLSLRFLVAIA